MCGVCGVGVCGVGDRVCGVCGVVWGVWGVWGEGVNTGSARVEGNQSNVCVCFALDATARDAWARALVAADTEERVSKSRRLVL